MDVLTLDARVLWATALAVLIGVLLLASGLVLRAHGRHAGQVPAGAVLVMVAGGEGAGTA